MRNKKMAFKSIVDGVNFMTPEVVDYFERGKFVAELSTSDDLFCGLHAFGVTVANTKDRKHEISMCRSFLNKDKETARKNALEYINSLA